MSRLTGTLLWLLLLSSGASQGQQEKPQETNPETIPETMDAAGPIAKQPAPAPTPTPEINEPPGEYRATEQISEDLSVSYPVDI
jgi:hypothetical protein